MKLASLFLLCALLGGCGGDDANGDSGGATGGGANTGGTSGTGATGSGGSGGVSHPPGPIVQLKLQSSRHDALVPFTIGHAFRRGEVPVGQFITANTPTFQADVKNTWTDGSVKFAVLSGEVTTDANGVVTLQLASTESPPTGTPPTLESVQNTLKDGSIEFHGDVEETVDVPSVLTTVTPFRSEYNAGKAMTEWHWRVPVGSDPFLEAWLFVRAYASGAVELELAVENGRLLLPNPSTKTYSVSVSYAGSERYSATIQHHYQSRWSRVDWYGEDPNLTAALDTAYLMETRLVPNYAWLDPTDDVLNAPDQSYTPMTLPNLPEAMGNTGAQDFIGLLMKVDALYLTSHGDPRAWNAVLATARGFGTYQTHFRDEKTNLPLAFSDHPHLCVSQDGNNIGANPQSTTGEATPAGTGAPAPGTWDAPHSPAPGYMAYLLTGRRVFLDELQFVTTAHYLSSGDGNRGASDSIFESTSAGTVRGAAWSLRTLAMATAMTPDDEPLRSELANAWAANMAHYRARYVDGSSDGGKFVNQLGVVLSYQTNGVNTSEYEPGNAHLFMASWMQAFLGASIGYAWDMEPVSDAAAISDHEAFRNFLYRHAVGMAGDDSGFNYRRGASYAMPYTQTESSDPLVWYPDFAQLRAAHESHYGLSPLSGNGALKQHDSDDDLTSGDSSTWPEGYWANMTPALAYAVEHAAPGAAEGLLRIQSSASWDFTAACSANPVWGIQPR